MRRENQTIGHFCNLMNYLCFNAEVWKKRCFNFLLKTDYLSASNTMLKISQKKLQVVVFNIVFGDRGEGGGLGEVRRERLYNSHLTCAHKRQECKFVSRILSMIADSSPSKFLSLWLVLSPPSASSVNGLVLHLVWRSLRALMRLKSPKKWKIIPAKSLIQKSRESKCTFHGSRKNRKPVSQGRKNIDSQTTEKINSHSRFTQNKNAHSRVTKKV